MGTWHPQNSEDDFSAAWQEVAAQAQHKPWLLKLPAAGGAALAARYALWKQRLQGLRLGERRRLQRRLGLSLTGAALLLALAASPGLGAPGAIMNVTDSTGTIANNSACSLPEAIINANANDQSGSTDCTAGSGADTIYLDTDVTLTASNYSTYGDNGLPVVTSAITIEGQGNIISRDSGAPTFRIMAVGSGGDLTLNGATVSGGVATGGSPPAYFGGGIFARYGAVTVTNSTLSGNSADSIGGGIYARGTLAVTNSTVSGNSAVIGGGIYAFVATTSLTNSTLSGNSAGFGGGGIRARYGTVSLTNSTLSGNSAGFGGGAIMASTGTLVVTNSIVAEQTAGGDCSYYSLTLTLGGYNIESGTSCGFTLASDQQNVSSASLNLKPLANTGGPTETHALGFGSVALDRIPLGTNECGGLIATDQRGITRPKDWGADDTPDKCDVGAWEGQPNQAPNAVALKGLRAAGGAPGGGLWAAALAGLGGLGLSAFFARRRSGRRLRSGSASAAAAQDEAPAALHPGFGAPSPYSPPAISSRGPLKRFAGSPLAVDPLALPEAE